MKSQSNVCSILESFQRNYPKDYPPVLSPPESDLCHYYSHPADFDYSEDYINIHPPLTSNSIALSRTSISLSNSDLLLHSSSSLKQDQKIMKCSNCGTTESKLWRKISTGEVLCNGCGLYYKLHGVVKTNLNPTDPVTMNNTLRNNISATKQPPSSANPLKRRLLDHSPPILMSMNEKKPKLRTNSLFSHNNNNNNNNSIPKTSEQDKVSLFKQDSPIKEEDQEQIAKYNVFPNLFATSSRSSTVTKSSDEFDTMIDQLLVNLDGDSNYNHKHGTTAYKQNMEMPFIGKQELHTMSNPNDNLRNTNPNNKNNDNTLYESTSPFQYQYEMSGVSNNNDDDYEWLKMAL